MPFCKRKCPYCDFYSLTDFEDHRRYVDALLLQMEDYAMAASPFTVDTIYIGGGTPTVVSERLLYDLMDGIYRNFKVFLDAETTIEANPATVDLSSLKKYKKMGVNRISFGVQSLSDKELVTLGRLHTAQEAIKSYEMARKAGFDNVSVDLMYGVPGQTVKSFTDTLRRITELDPEHVSVYGLKIEPGTHFDEIKDTLEFPDEDTEFKMYESAIAMLRSRGYAQYEISNFAKPGKECRHNNVYWTLGEYLGIGPGAHSYFNGSRFSFKRDINAFIEAQEQPEADIDIIDENYRISPNERVGEYIMLSLRLTKGIDLREFTKQFGLDFEKMYGELLDAYVDGGFMTRLENGYAFTPKGMYVSNYILSDMLDFDSEIDRNIANGSDR